MKSCRDNVAVAVCCDFSPSSTLCPAKKGMAGKSC